MLFLSTSTVGKPPRTPVIAPDMEGLPPEYMAPAITVSTTTAIHPARGKARKPRSHLSWFFGISSRDPTTPHAFTTRGQISPSNKDCILAEKHSARDHELPDWGDRRGTVRRRLPSCPLRQVLPLALAEPRHAVMVGALCGRGHPPRPRTVWGEFPQREDAGEPLNPFLTHCPSAGARGRRGFPCGSPSDRLDRWSDPGSADTLTLDETMCLWQRGVQHVRVSPALYPPPRTASRPCASSVRAACRSSEPPGWAARRRPFANRSSRPTGTTACAPTARPPTRRPSSSLSAAACGSRGGEGDPDQCRGPPAPMSVKRLSTVDVATVEIRVEHATRDAEPFVV